MEQLNSLSEASKKLKDSPAKEAAVSIHRQVSAYKDTYLKDSDLVKFKAGCQSVLSNDNSLVKKLNNYVDIKRVLFNLAALIFTLGIAHIALYVSKSHSSFFLAPQAADIAERLANDIKSIADPQLSNS